ncbi:MAG: tRNA uridine-5-carboxymethylaminomethyl(34) synthesis enzyme MnmG [Candidatus Omnitrophica bacterium]|jgi:tRNA uridine 5-carboxymethylaminomethyl modification enzyme|nr:tRNA uridine-5-carboxymethylaminomethyl(34) synthesis enzyme MnmG [Candidatus Omnitrophota bacterium]
MIMEKYDCIVIGAGHAGIEASYAAAKSGCRVLILTIDIDTIGKLSCNPAVGGVCKGHLVREIDALGGLMGRITDRCALGYRILNRSKGKAVWSTRAQVDMFSYAKIAKDVLEKTENITILQGKVEKILTKNKSVIGVETDFGQEFYAKTIIVCAGTFLKSKIHIGLNNFPGGRLCEQSSDKLFDSIKQLGFKTKHFKTGTCARLNSNTLDFSKMIEQVPDKDVEPFSFRNTTIPKKQLSCFITYTNKKTRQVILDNLKYSPLYTGKISSTGVRYCPSLEDKMVKFPQHERHQVFIEPEGKDSLEVYPNGISSSLPFDVQADFIHSIEGLEKAAVLRPGYGIEHGLIDARQLDVTLESKIIGGLYFSGQVNGTTGYEEAAAQGLIAGINAALKVKMKKPFIVGRDIAYIGVLLDDLISKGTDEPYRMFTSRSEFRLSLRETNTGLRLGRYGYKLGLIDKAEYQIILDKKNILEKSLEEIKTRKVIFNGQKLTLFNILKRPQVSFNKIKGFLDNKNLPLGIQREIETISKYESFLAREADWSKELNNFAKIKIKSLDFAKVPSLSKEIIEKLQKFKPVTLKEAFNISGVTPAAVLNILNFVKHSKNSA